MYESRDLGWDPLEHQVTALSLCLALCLHLFIISFLLFRILDLSL